MLTTDEGEREVLNPKVKIRIEKQMNYDAFYRQGRKVYKP
jgi:hypothetical protein